MPVLPSKIRGILKDYSQALYDFKTDK